MVCSHSEEVGLWGDRDVTTGPRGAPPFPAPPGLCRNPQKRELHVLGSISGLSLCRELLYSGGLSRTFLGWGERTLVVSRKLGLEAGSEGWGCALVVVCPPRWPCAALLVCLLPASPSFFLGTCRCFRRQSQGAEEGRVSAHVILQGGLRGPGPQVALPEGTCLPSMAPLSRQTKVLSSGSPGAGELRSPKHGPSCFLEGTLPGVSLLLHIDPLETPLGLFRPQHLRGG